MGFHDRHASKSAQLEGAFSPKKTLGASHKMVIYPLLTTLINSYSEHGLVANYGMLVKDTCA